MISLVMKEIGRLQNQGLRKSGARLDSGIKLVGWLEDTGFEIVVEGVMEKTRQQSPGISDPMEMEVLRHDLSGMLSKGALGETITHASQALKNNRVLTYLCPPITRSDAKGTLDGIIRQRSGRSADRLARLHGVQEVGGSNPLAPTKFEGCYLAALFLLSFCDPNSSQMPYTFPEMIKRHRFLFTRRKLLAGYAVGFIREVEFPFFLCEVAGSALTRAAMPGDDIYIPGG